ncbi:hypothetical protein SLS58_005021 [Diplodia intermedia]|uniref:Xylanolytic transcriptional activator regulatory domain-containing protein n=1 Tax=Diplodia intermedia TaxID=856260 RepID=A0ABR3TRT6_9PEZI
MFLTFVSTPSTAPSSSKGRARVRHAQQHPPPALSRSADSSAPPPASPAPAPAPAPDAVDALGPEFAVKINHYFSSIATVVPEQVLDSPPPPQYSAIASTLQCADQPALHLTGPQRSALLRLYVRRLHQAAPVVDLAQLRGRCHDESPLPLLCAVFGLSIQHAACSGLATRMLDLAMPATTACRDASLAGYELMARCRRGLAVASLEPSFTDVQCHVLIALYLVNAGQLQAAYNLLGSAVRAAYCLDLHADELGRRLWWCLVQLDLRCSSLLARPPAFRRSDMACPFPADSRREWSLHVHSVKLTAAVLSASSPGAHWSFDEAHARGLADQLGPVLEWEAAVCQTTIFSDLELDPGQTMAAFEQQQDLVSPGGQDERSMQRVLLKIHYHDSLMALLRSFIRFPFKSISPVRSPGVDRHATAAVAHALALTATVLDGFRRGDLLYGWCGVYQSLWNALLTMAGFVLSYPLCRYSCTARRLLPETIAVFDMVSPRISTPARFAALGRDLLGRVERLVAFVEEKQREKEEASSSSVAMTVTMPSSTSGESVSDALGDVEGQAIIAAPADPDQQAFLDCHHDQEDMWSWMDIVDPSNWPDYRDGVDQLFTDIIDLDLLMDEPWRGMQQQ